MSVGCFAANRELPGVKFGDLAVLLAKGYFKNYVPKDAPMEQCVTFLNEKGISFSLFDLLDPLATVSEEDVARVVGQSKLLLSGEAELRNGRIKKPEEAETWIDYCILNDIDLVAISSRLLDRVAQGNLPEVEQFYSQRSGPKTN